jgi:hypothetical protein
MFSAVNVFPNPAADNVTVQFTSAGATNVSLTVIDNSGKQVAATQQVVINEGKNAIELPVAHLQNGWYYVSMIAENGATRTIKLAVQK